MHTHRDTNTITFLFIYLITRIGGALCREPSLSILILAHQASELKDNYITTIEAGAFSNLPVLRTLYCPSFIFPRRFFVHSYTHPSWILLITSTNGTITASVHDQPCLNEPDVQSSDGQFDFTTSSIKFLQLDCACHPVGEILSL